MILLARRNRGFWGILSEAFEHVHTYTIARGHWSVDGWIITSGTYAPIMKCKHSA